MTAAVPLMAHAARRTPAVHQMGRRRVDSRLFGEMIVSEDSILEFPDGLFGFASCKQWVMVTAERAGWCWLHALDHPALAFLLADPFEAVREFSVELSAQDLAVLGARSATEVAVFAIVTLPRVEGDVMTMNLQGPVAIALPARRGRQLVLGDARFGAKVPLHVSASNDPHGRAQVLR